MYLVDREFRNHGARGETRTLTLLRAEDFESSASTIPPPGLSRESGIILIFLQGS